MNMEAEARRRVRVFVKRVKQRKWLETVTGVRNGIERVEGAGFWVKPKKASQAFLVKRKSLERAALHFYYVRTLTKNEVEKFSNFSSLLFGALEEMFRDISDLRKLAGGMIRIILRGIRVFLSGAQSSPGDLALAAECNAKWVLFSYAYLRFDLAGNFIRYRKKFGLEIMLDSGAFTVMMSQKGLAVKPLDLNDYICFIKKYKAELFSYASLDVVGDPEQSFRNYVSMREAGLDPMPIYHLGDPYEYLEKYLTYEPSLIGIGGVLKVKSKVTRKKLLEDLFEKYPTAAYHGFGIVDQNLYSRPWHSVDTAACFVAPRKFRNILSFRGQIPMPANWTAKQGIAWSVNFLKRFEWLYDGQVQGNLLVP
jgi:hypothetical protein